MGPVSTATKQSMMNARIQLFLLVTQSGTSACGMVPPPFRVGLCTSIHIIYTQKFVCTLILTLINLIKLTSQSLKQPGRTQHSASFIGPATFCGCLTTDLKDLPLPWATMAPRPGSQAPTFKAFLWSFHCRTPEPTFWFHCSISKPEQPPENKKRQVKEDSRIGWKKIVPHLAVLW